MLLHENTCAPKPKIVAAMVHATVSATRDRKLSFMRRIILPALPQCREHGPGGETIFEGHNAPLYRTREGILRGAEPLRGGDEEAVTPLLGLPDQRDALYEVALGPETEDLELDDLSRDRV